VNVDAFRSLRTLLALIVWHQTMILAVLCGGSGSEGGNQPD